MIKIYTPKSYLSFFKGYPFLIIDDDGKIYKEEDYHKFMGYPIGKIDLKSGKIYGDDYDSFSPNPLGRVKKRDDYYEIYDKGYYVLNERPKAIVKDNKVYDYEEFQKIFGVKDPKYYFESDQQNNSERSITKEIKEAHQSDDYKERFTDNSGNLGKVAFIIIGVLATFGTYDLLAHGHKEMLLYIAVPFVVSIGVYIFNLKKEEERENISFKSIVEEIIILSGGLSWIGGIIESIIELINGTGKVSDFFLVLFLGIFVTVIFCFGNSMIFGGIVYLLLKRKN